ncbi:hypothetical protein BRPE64_DCDS09080 (plasmid) [Caballeronia insecticola]|uniref:Uncharacterized protein n=1 Tax=Caballeronia insecticola TaxID=758793 RepID=R4WTE8_9BURK|nr:hypothetical protein BRPE64_DCDS09080 [Caballeronia insecticola]
MEPRGARWRGHRRAITPWYERVTRRHDMTHARVAYAAYRRLLYRRILHANV